MKTQTLSRKSILLEQLETSWEFFRPSMDDLSDEEFFWQARPEWWSIRKREDVRTPGCFGKGPWVLEDGPMRPDAEPMVTVAWLIGHLAGTMLVRGDYTFGGKSLSWNDLEFPHSASQALTFLDDAYGKWHAGLASLEEEALDVVGLCSYPEGLDPEMPFTSCWWWNNREFIHHTAEIGIIRYMSRLSN